MESHLPPDTGERAPLSAQQDRPGRWKTELIFVLDIYRDGLPVGRQSLTLVIITWQRPDQQWNPQLLDRKCDALPLCHQATQPKGRDSLMLSATARPIHC